MDGRFLRANWAGPRLEGGVPSTWWQLDLGPAHALVCNYYTLRHDASANFLRSWAFQVARHKLHLAAVNEAARQSCTVFVHPNDMRVTCTEFIASHGMLYARLPLHQRVITSYCGHAVKTEAIVTAVCPDIRAGIT